MVSNDYYGISLCWRQYGIIIVTALITLGFHTCVNHRFYQMVSGMRDAATERKELQYKKFELFDHHRQELHYRKLSHNHAQEAYESQEILADLFHNITKERKETYDLVEESKQLKKQARDDAEEYWAYAVEAKFEGLMSIEDRIDGIALAGLAENETADADLYMDISIAEEEEGNKRLADAQMVLDSVKQVENKTANEQEQGGICTWMNWACVLVRGNSNLDEAKKATSLAVAAAAEMDSALQEIEDAHQKYNFAHDLYEKAAQHGNQSVELLNEANELHDDEEEDISTALGYATKYETELAESKKDKEMAIQEELQLVRDDISFREYSIQKNNLTLMARSEQFRANQLHTMLSNGRRDIEEMELRIWKLIKAARHHVAHASWYALLACLSAGCVLSLISVRVITSFRTLHPLIVREDPFLFKDLIYIIAHIFIFLLSMGFAGDILVDFVHISTWGRIEIVFLFALVGTTFQAIALHLVPNLYIMIFLQSASSVNKDSIFTILVEDVAKRSVAVFLVFGMEVLLCWVNFGENAFTNAHKLNRWSIWILVVLAAIAHCYFASKIPEEPVSAAESSDDNYRVADVQPRVDVEIGSVPLSSSSRTTVQENPEEAATLLPNSSGGISSLTDSSLWLSVNLNSSGPPSSSARHYGSMPHGTRLVPRRVRATFISSWRMELDRIWILVEILIASWALWVIRRNVKMIVKLARLPSTEAWGKFPMWILAVIIISIIACFVRAYRNFRSEINLHFNGQQPRTVTDSAVTLTC